MGRQLNQRKRRYPAPPSGAGSCRQLCRRGREQDVGFRGLSPRAGISHLRTFRGRWCVVLGCQRLRPDWCQCRLQRSHRLRIRRCDRCAWGTTDAPDDHLRRCPNVDSRWHGNRDCNGKLRSARELQLEDGRDLFGNRIDRHRRRLGDMQHRGRSRWQRPLSTGTPSNPRHYRQQDRSIDWFRYGADVIRTGEYNGQRCRQFWSGCNFQQPHADHLLGFGEHGQFRSAGELHHRCGSSR